MILCQHILINLTLKRISCFRWLLTILTVSSINFNYPICILFKSAILIVYFVQIDKKIHLLRKKQCLM